MKNKAIVIVMALMLLLVGCGTKSNSQSNDKTIQMAIDSEEMRAIWISYYEYDFSVLNKSEAAEKISLMMDNVAAAKLNNVFLHVRANCDAIYPSKIFPLSNKANKDYDVLKIFIEEAHKRNLKLHAWINPFRISGADNSTASPLPEGSIITYADKFYLNPAVPQVQSLIIDGVKELTDNYSIDGIIFDDYFYPTADATFDSVTYEEYAKNCSLPLSISEWRAANISSLILTVHNITKEKVINFGISPTAHLDIEKNGYLDVSQLLSSEDYIDYIIPQIYWGYEYPAEEYRFDNMVNSWKEKTNGSNVKLYVGIAAYKAGTEDHGNEWIDNHDIISRQILTLRENNINGFAIFSYLYFFSENIENTVERMNYLATI